MTSSSPETLPSGNSLGDHFPAPSVQGEGDEELLLPPLDTSISMKKSLGDAETISTEGQCCGWEDDSEKIEPPSDATEQSGEGLLSSLPAETSPNATEESGTGLSSSPLPEPSPNATEQSGGGLSSSSLAETSPNATEETDETLSSSPMADMSTDTAEEEGEVSASPVAQISSNAIEEGDDVVCSSEMAGRQSITTDKEDEVVSASPVAEISSNAIEEINDVVSSSEMVCRPSNATDKEDEVVSASPVAEILSKATYDLREVIPSSAMASDSNPRDDLSTSYLDRSEQHWRGVIGSCVPSDSPCPPPIDHAKVDEQHQSNPDTQQGAILTEHLLRTNSDKESSSHMPLSENQNINVPLSSNPTDTGTSAGVQQRENVLLDHLSDLHQPLPSGKVASKTESKYKAYTRSPSDGEDIRWYFCKSVLGPNELAASTPATDVVGKGECLRFSLRDSSSLETVFLEREEEFVSAWWKEYAECSRGPFNTLGRSSNRPFSSNKTSMKATEKVGKKETMDSTDGSRKYEACYSKSMSEDADEEIVGVPVKGGLYEVDILRRRCFPVYWSGDNRRVLRGHWFARKGALDWLPLREDVAEQLEIAYRAQVWHRRTFQPSGQYAARVDLQGATPGLHALFTGEDDSWEAWLDADAHGIIYVLGLQGNGVKLRRGFAPSGSPQPTRDELRQRKEEEIDDYCSQVPVRHLVFMVHGIGQRLEKANLVDDVGTFRRTVAGLAEQHLTSFQRNTQRVLFIPCQWRRHLKLGGESAVEDCTLEGVRALRQMISATVHDVLYYMSPIYCQDIIDSVSSSLNRLYQKFVKRNPGYDGKVSLYGHSLGSVLSYDILCHQKDFSFRDALRSSTLEGSSFEKEEEEGAQQIPCIENDASSVKKLKAVKDKIISLQAILHCLEGRQSEGHSQTKTLEGLQVAETENQLLEKCSSHTDDLSESSMTSTVSGNAEDYESETADCQRRHDLDSSYVGSPNLSTLSREKSNAISSRKGHIPNIFYTKLQFKVDTFFAVGSPLGLFLGLRNVRLGIGRGTSYWQAESIEEEMPACRQMLNIFHPYDPVAYRVEPLVCKEYVQKPPVFIPYHRGGRRLHIGMQEFNEGLTARSKAISRSVRNVKTRVANMFRPMGSDKGEDVEETNEGEDKQRTYGSLIIERLTGSIDGRIDFMLQDSTFEHQYISALSSHTSYWQDNDTALFILKHLYRDIPELQSVDNTAPTADVNTEKASYDLTFDFFSKDEFVAVLSHDVTM